MEWLRNRRFLNKQPRALLCAEEDCDPQACHDSFKEHWHQALKIILRVQQSPMHDEVSCVMNHLEHMVTLLLYDIKKMNEPQVPQLNSSECVDYLLEENILDKLNKWGMKAGVYSNAVKCEQLKIYEMLLSQSRHILLVHEPFLKPLLTLLKSCQTQIFSKEMEKFLVDLLYQLCALLMQNTELIDLFFCPDQFIIFVLLITFVHRDDSIGMRARDALLLCMSMSKKNSNLAEYITKNSNFSILVASGLSGLYSVLPNSLDDVTIPDWHRFTPDDVNDIKGLSTFVTSLEFSNAVAQVAHPSIRKQLQEFMYRGFLIPVLGPALLQNTDEEQIASMAYSELILRTLTNPGLLFSLLQFLLIMDYDGQRLLDLLIQRINSKNNQLALISLSLFSTMIDLNCEDLMVELVFQYLQPCLHLMLSQRSNSLPQDPYSNNFENFLKLAPTCCDIESNSPKLDDLGSQWHSSQSLCGRYDSYLYDARNRIATCQLACYSWSNSYNGGEVSQESSNCKGTTTDPPSYTESIGYESFNAESNTDTIKPFWHVSTARNAKQKAIVETRSRNSENAGSFLMIILGKLKNYLANSFYVNLHLTGLISRLAIFPQALLRTYLIDHTLVLQPDVPSLIQIIGSVKQQIDDYMNKRSDRISLIKFAKKFLIERESRLVNARRHIIEQCSPEINEYFQRNSSKRRSLNLPIISGMFGRRSSNHMEPGLPLVQNVENSLEKIYPKFNESQHVALCAVLLEEWVKELAAIAQEHTIAQLGDLLN